MPRTQQARIDAEHSEPRASPSTAFSTESASASRSRSRPSVGLVVAAAVLAHDFSDGINTVTVVLKNRGRRIRALKWLLLDALAPLLGVVSTYFYSLSQAALGLVLALFCGFFLYIGAADLLPESHHRHPKRLTAALNIAGAALIWITIHLAAI